MSSVKRLLWRIVTAYYTYKQRRFWRLRKEDVIPHRDITKKYAKVLEGDRI